MVDINPTISIITLNVNGLKDRDYQNGLRNKTQLYVVYQKPTLNIKTEIDLRQRDGKRHTMLTLIKRKLE